jgi:hypothetical protein
MPLIYYVAHVLKLAGGAVGGALAARATPQTAQSRA